MRKKYRKLTFKCCLCFLWDFPGGSDSKSVCLQCGRSGFDPCVGKVPWRRKWHPTAVLLPGKPHGWRSLVGYSPWGRRESDTTEQLHFHFHLQCRRRRRCRFNPWVGRFPERGHDNSLHYSCLETSMDRGARQAIVHRVTKSRIWLKQLSMHEYTVGFNMLMVY